MIEIRKRLSSESGFTLLELMVVVIIIVLLASAIALEVNNKMGQARHARAVSDVDTLGSALDQFQLNCGRYPTTDEGLNALRVKPQSSDLTNWAGPYIKKAVPLDPWNRAYIYVSPGVHNPESYDLSSLGKDGKEGGDGEDADITNWD
jgi:general secretion pathway protein G